MTDPLDQIARICAEAPEDALSRIADVLGFKEQQAEPGADERLHPDHISAVISELRVAQKYEKPPRLDARDYTMLIGVLAAQSGQRAGVAEDSARMDWIEHNVHSLEWRHSKPYMVTDFFGKQHTGNTAREAIDAAKAAAPTRQQEGGL